MKKAHWCLPRLWSVPLKLQSRALGVQSYSDPARSVPVKEGVHIEY
jgi:hypothetical protein